MTATWADVLANRQGVSHHTHVCFTVGGAGSAWNNGYQWDLGETLNPDVWTHQPIGYPAAAFPMKPSTDAGEVEFVRQLGLWDCAHRTWGFNTYSEGAIVSSNILDRCGITPSARTPDLAQYASTFIGGATWGNPRREQGSHPPGAVDKGGHGIVTPNLVNTPATVWDFASCKGMVDTKGQDLYTTCGYDGDPYSVTDEEAIWNIVKNGTFSSVLPLAEQVLKLFSNPTASLIAAAYAVIDAGMFFFAEGLTPHTSYQFVQPIPGDPRDCWALALDHMQQLGAATPARAAA